MTRYHIDARIENMVVFVIFGVLLGALLAHAHAKGAASNAEVAPRDCNRARKAVLPPAGTAQHVANRAMFSLVRSATR